MRSKLSRRAALASAAAVCLSGHALASNGPEITARVRIAELEKKHGGRLGVSIVDTQSNLRVDHRQSERFAMCSTFKFLAAACVLSRVDRGIEKLDRRVTYEAKDLMPNSPVTKERVADGLTMGELCAAAVEESDNTAANLMLASFGGPAGWTAYARSLGDKVSRLDRMEPELNDWKPGEPRDTTTPAATAENLRKIVLGNALSASSRDLITQWLVGSKTGAKRLRLGMPTNWQVGDKTGTSSTDIANDIAVAWPPGRAPLVVTCYFAGAPITNDQRNAVIAEVGAIGASLVS
jgi:beta-lactamase class A